jgi:hypothetical protein
MTSGPTSRDGIEIRLERWLHEQPIESVAPELRHRLLAIPATAPATRAWFAPLLLAALTVVVAIGVTVAALAFIGPNRVGPPGPPPDCASEPDQLLGYALRRRESTDGYRWSDEEETWGFDPAFPVSADDPHYGWSGYRSEGAYRAPDLMRARTTDSDEPERMLGPMGFTEIVHIAGRTYGYSPGMTDPAGEPLGFDWQEIPSAAMVDANYVMRAFPPVDQLGDFTLEPATLSWEIPGSGGCEIVRAMSRPAPSGVEQPPPFVIGVRVDHLGRIVAGAWELDRPDASAEERFGELRYRFSVAYDIPDESEFSPPAGPIYTYPPEPLDR